MKKEVAPKPRGSFFLLLPKRGHLVDKIRTANIRKMWAEKGISDAITNSVYTNSGLEEH